MRPAGPAAAHIDELWWVMLVLGTLVFIVVMGFLVAALRRRRPDMSAARAAPDENRRMTRWVVAGGAIVPAAILGVVLVLTMRALGALAWTRGERDLTVVVTGRQFWWEVHYEGGAAPLHFETANEIHIPTGRRVRLRLRSGDVIHSFWVPELAGKMDLIPGRTNEIWIQADRPGIFRGQCAEFCGTQHANMLLTVVAQPPDEYARWLAAQRRAAAEPADDIARRGRELFDGGACALCHAVRGTGAGGQLGPDLTHIGSRRTLAAGAIPNTHGHLMGWVSDPQSIKPGSLMPHVPLQPAELHAVVRYLETLR